MDNEKEYYLPYDFVPIEDRREYRSEEDYGQLTGVITVSLKTITPVIAIKQYEQERPNAKLFPASSIRGMLRNASEIIWNDFLIGRTYSQHSRKKDKSFEKVKEEWTVVNNFINEHSYTSHLFGFVSPIKKNGESQSLGSVLRFTDAISKNAKYQDVYKKKFALSVPQGLLLRNKERFNSLYLNKDQTLAAGRKVYLAGKIATLKKLLFTTNVKKELKDYVGESDLETEEKVRLIFPNSDYTFHIYFKKLKEEDLANIIRLIELTEDATHCIGGGKPLGLGRVKLTVDCIKLQSKENLFQLDKPIYDETIDKETLLRTTPNPFQSMIEKYAEFGNIQLFDNKKMYSGNRFLQNIKIYKYSSKQKKE